MTASQNLIAAHSAAMDGLEAFNKAQLEFNAIRQGLRSAIRDELKDVTAPFRKTKDLKPGWNAGYDALKDEVAEFVWHEALELPIDELPIKIDAFKSRYQALLDQFHAPIVIVKTPKVKVVKPEPEKVAKTVKIKNTKTKKSAEWEAIKEAQAAQTTDELGTVETVLA